MWWWLEPVHRKRRAVAASRRRPRSSIAYVPPRGCLALLARLACAGCPSDSGAMMRLLLTAVVLATPLRATATNATTPTTNATWPEWWPEGRNRVIDARVGRWHILVPPSGTTTIGNKTMWSMCNAAGTPGKHFRDCEKGCNSLGGTLVSVEDQAQQRLLRHFVGEDIDLLIGAYQRTYKSPDSGWRWTSAARPDHSFTAWRRGYPADVGAHLSRNHRGTPSVRLRVTQVCAR